MHIHSKFCPWNKTSGRDAGERQVTHVTQINTLIVATYNVHSCIGRDRACDAARIVAVLAEIGADIVALQEVGHRHHDGPSEQVDYFRDRLGMHIIPGLNLLYGRRPFGNALLSRWPAIVVRRHDLSVQGREPRGAIDAEFDLTGRKLRVIATHLGLGPGERRHQVGRISHVINDGPDLPMIIMGDFNIFGAERRRLRSLGAPVARRQVPASFPARMPVLGLDRIWARPQALIHRLYAHRSPLAAIASDHLPVVACLTLRSLAVGQTVRNSGDGSNLLRRVVG